LRRWSGRGVLRLPEIKAQHELDRLCIAQCDELTPAAIIMCCFEGDVCEKIFDQLKESDVMGVIEGASATKKKAA
jgi:hypothetical protein